MSNESDRGPPLRSATEADRSVVSRRAWLSRFSAAAGCALCAGAARAQTQRPVGALIDTHHHIVPPIYAARRKAELLASSPGAYKVLSWTPEQSLADMDKVGVTKAILSVSTPGIWFGDPMADAALARECNEFAARMSADHPGRFGSFAALPLPDVDASLEEITHALDVLKAEGVALMTSYAGKYPGDSAFAPVFEELNRRGAVVYFHPTGAQCCRNVQTDTLEPGIIEFPFDTTRAIASLLYSGTLGRNRRIRWLFSHGGGATPMLAYRMTGPTRNSESLKALMPDGPLAELARLYYDTTSVENAPAMAALLKLAPVEQLTFGSDYPFGGALAPHWENLNKLGLSRSDLAKISHQNAERLLRPVQNAANGLS